MRAWGAAAGARAGVPGGDAAGGALGHRTCAPRHRGRPPRRSRPATTRGCCCGHSVVDQPLPALRDLLKHNQYIGRPLNHKYSII